MELVDADWDVGDTCEVADGVGELPTLLEAVDEATATFSTEVLLDTFGTVDATDEEVLV